jgi:hypothetical protein
LSQDKAEAFALQRLQRKLLLIKDMNIFVVLKQWVMEQFAWLICI